MNLPSSADMDFFSISIGGVKYNLTSYLPPQPPTIEEYFHFTRCEYETSGDKHCGFTRPELLTAIAENRVRILTEDV